jgi:hypothetical protein
VTVEDRLRRALPPDAEGARTRAWDVVRSAAPLHTTKMTTTVTIVIRSAAAATAVALFALSGAGAATGEWVKRTIAPPQERAAEPTPPGGAAWSPHKLFVAVWSGRDLRALEPDGDPRWRITAPAEIRNAVWSPDGLRIAYVAGGRTRIVSGNGTNDHALLGGATGSTTLRWSKRRPQELTYGHITRDVGTGVVVKR